MRRIAGRTRREGRSIKPSIETPTTKAPSCSLPRKRRRLSAVPDSRETRMMVPTQGSSPSRPDTGRLRMSDALHVIANAPTASSAVLALVQADTNRSFTLWSGGGGAAFLAGGVAICFSHASPILAVLTCLVAGFVLLGASAVRSSGKAISVKDYKSLLSAGVDAGRRIMTTSPAEDDT